MIEGYHLSSSMNSKALDVLLGRGVSNNLVCMRLQGVGYDYVGQFDLVREDTLGYVPGDASGS